MLVLELDILGDSDSILCDLGSSEALLDDDVAPLRAEGDLDSVGQGIDAARHEVASLGGKAEILARGKPAREAGDVATRRGAEH